MKHSVAIKFIAILLCAASLLAVVGSSLSIYILTENGLYNKTVDDLYAEWMEDKAHGFAEQLAQNYASTNLGGCPKEMLRHYQYLNAGCYGYTLMDESGQILDSLSLEDAEAVITYEIPVSGSYMRVLNTYPATQETIPETDSPFIYDTIVDEEIPVYNCYYAWGDTSESFGSDEPIGVAGRDVDGMVFFLCYDNSPFAATDVEHIVLHGPTGEPIFELRGNGPVGHFFTDSEGAFRFRAYIPTTPTGGELAATEPVTSFHFERFSYYDTEENAEMVVEYEWAVMPAYTVRLYLAEGAIPDTDHYSLAGILSQFRDYFPWLLGIGILVFAVTLVYLCCAAARKPGCEEIRPGGLNRLPLDLYLGLGGLGMAGLGLACLEGGSALFREQAEIGIGFAGAMAYLMALLSVAFVFAFTAQVKTPGGYWYRNTLCGRCLILALRFFRRLNRGLRKFWPIFRSGIRTCWNRLLGAAVAIWKFFAVVVTTLWKYGRLYTVKTCQFIKTTLTRFFRWLFRNLGRFFSLLPLTWQWLITGFALLFLMFCTIRAGSGGWMLLCFCCSLAIIVYGAQCFGTLLESAKNMRKGDLEAKVDDKFLIGSFRDFSTELNGLAGVATVAVQKQLKSERMKAELVTNVSHDIKTPLTSIINYVDLMKKPHTEEEHELYLEVLDRQSLRLKKLIEDLMEMSKASTGNIAVDLTRVDAAEAVNQALGEFDDKFHTVNLTPVFHQPEKPVEILADGRLVWRVLSNLLSNACKYALPGTRLYLDLLTLEGSGIITIKNISREQLNVDAEELMERFVRGDASRNTEGSGLGLNIAKSLVELQGGKMELMVDGDLFKVTLIFPLA